jgi:molecular chaperone HtpG
MADAASSARTYGFQAEVRQLLHLMVHSLYSEREIFLRELISNASDANDRLRFEALSKPDLLGSDTQLEIAVRLDPDAGVISVADTGIGMSEADIVEQLGTIAHSGTGRFLERLTGDQRKDSQLIGQFGVGFYSAFIVADEVEVRSRHAGSPESAGVLWRSDGQGEFSVEGCEKAERGTEVRLKLKGDAKEFLEDYRVRALIHKYSDHIAFPVKLYTGNNGEAQTVNQAQALWTRPRSEVTEQEYIEFYKHITHDFTDPLSWTHNRVEGKREYTSLLYLPAVAPFDLWNREAPRGLKLYVRRVFITDHATHFLPLYLRFIRGVVDAGDLSLNVSREMLQQDPHVAAIRSALTKRTLDLIGKLADEDPEKYATFWEQFGGVLKEGIAEDGANRERIAGLLRLHSTASGAGQPDRKLDDYLAAMPASQDKIYYLVAESLGVAKSSPHLEMFREREIEVLLLTDRMDEWMMQYLTEYQGKPFRDVSRGALDLEGTEGKEDVAAQPDETDTAFLERVKSALGDRVDNVRVSGRLKESAACLVLGDHDLGFQMREMLKAVGHDAPESKPSLELNPGHPLIERLRREATDADFERLALIVFDQALLTEGRQLEDPAAYVRRVNEFLSSLGSKTQ